MNRLKQFLVPAYMQVYKIYTLYISPYKYVKDKYSDSFVSKVHKVKAHLSKAEEVIYVFWTGNNILTPNRKIGLQSLKENSGVNVKLITPKNIDEYLIKEYPLHDGYKYLSLIQKSDYLRCYFMLHHGGGYADIKPCLRSWKNLFYELNKNRNKWCIGPREKYVGCVAHVKGAIGLDIKKYHNNLINNGAFIYKPNSPICKEWMKEIHARMDFYLPELIKNPGGIFDEGNYPIPWAYLAGHLMHPLVLKYHERIIPKDIKLYSNKNYR
jgi:hypothetical protein